MTTGCKDGSSAAACAEVKGTFKSGQKCTSNTCTVSSGPTYTKDVQPILLKYCANCHGGQGGHSVAMSYKEAMKMSSGKYYTKYCGSGSSAKTVGECSVLLVAAGIMPKFGGKLTSSEISTLKNWLKAGMPE